MTTWTKPAELSHIQLRGPEAEAGVARLPAYIPRPRLPPPRHYRPRLQQLDTRHAAAAQQRHGQVRRTGESEGEDSFLWGIWRNGIGSIFDRKERDDEEDRRSQRNSRTNLDSLASPVVDSIGRIVTKSLVNYLTNEVTNYLSSDDDGHDDGDKVEE